MPRISRRMSSISTYRSKTPTSPRLAEYFTNFTFGHLTQRNTLPQATLGSGSDNDTQWGPCNSSGTSTVSANAKTGQVLGGDGMAAPTTDPGCVEV